MDTRNVLRNCLHVLVLSFLLLVPQHLLAETAAQFIEALSPNSSSSKVRARGLGGVQALETQPQKAMHLKFALNSAELATSAKATLDQLGIALQSEELHSYAYRLEGHTCDLGSSEFNEYLSKQRALAVQHYLMNQYSLQPQQLEVVWYGESRPLVPNTDESTRKQNRRVMIVNTLKMVENITDKPSEGIHVRLLRDGVESWLADGQSMTSDDTYAVEFKTTAESYVYIFQKDGIGKLSQIFPNTQVSHLKNPIQPDSPYRLPESGKWFFLDDTRGEEEVLMIAAESPLEDSIATAREVLTTGKYDKISRGLGGIHRKKPKAQIMESPDSDLNPPHAAGEVTDGTSAENGSDDEPPEPETMLSIYRRVFNHE